MKDGGPAFPANDSIMANNTFAGMSLRDWFAGMAMQGFSASGRQADTDEMVAGSFMVADAMLAERDRQEDAKGAEVDWDKTVASCLSGNSCKLLEAHGDGVGIHGHWIIGSDQWNRVEVDNFLHAMRCFQEEVQGHRQEETKND